MHTFSNQYVTSHEILGSQIWLKKAEIMRKNTYWNNEDVKMLQHLSWVICSAPPAQPVIPAAAGTGAPEPLWPLERQETLQAHMDHLWFLQRWQEDGGWKMEALRRSVRVLLMRICLRHPREQNMAVDTNVGLLSGVLKRFSIICSAWRDPEPLSSTSSLESLRVFHPVASLA